jgi:transcriptional regulator with XRE-family HTH domain
MKPENVRMGKRIATARENRGWSKADLARKAGVAASYITRIEQGAFDRPSIDLVRSIADALHVTVADLAETEPVPALVDMRAVLMAKGFRPDQTHIVDQILNDMANQDDERRGELLNAVATLLALHNERTNR